jgi:hypothetical protein
MKSLSTIDVSNNDFRGFISESFFQLPLQSVNLAKNCFIGNIPDEICQATNITTLDLDGLTAGNKCIKRMLQTYTSHYITGTIPICLFSMPKLQQLHISGNGLHGKLPAETVISSSLLNISLAYNRLSGVLPQTFQSFPFLNFDISYNKISGTCEHLTMNLKAEGSNNTQKSTNLNLQVNRLSGNLAPSFHDATDINVVTGISYFLINYYYYMYIKHLTFAMWSSYTYR